MANKGIKVSDSMLTSIDGMDASFFDDVVDFDDAKKPSLSNIPMAKLMQTLSPEVRDRRTYPNIYPGCIINSDTKDVIGGMEDDTDHVMDVYVLKSWRSRVKFPPRNSGVTGVECSCPTYHSNGQEDWGTVYGKCATCQYAPFGTRDGCRQQYTMVVCLASDPSVKFRIILSKTSYKGAKKFEDDWKEAAKPIYNKFKKYPNFYALKVSIYGAEEVNKAQDHYYVYDIKVHPYEAMSAELREQLKNAKAEVEELYADSLDYHKKMVDLQKEKTVSTDVEPEAAKGYNALDEAFGNVDSAYVVPGNESDIPF